MRLPLTRSALERLGKRLEKVSGPDQADLASLQGLLVAYDDVLQEAVEKVRGGTSLEPTSRLKTTGTILDKIRRHGGSILKDMQDIAGMRIVSEMDRAVQDDLAANLASLFAGCGRREPKIVDRRDDPTSGYRAVHVVAWLDDATVEVQIRTGLQHRWADTFEKLGDLLGREIRYDHPPSSLVGQAEDLLAGVVEDAAAAPILAACADRDEVRLGLYKIMLRVSEAIDKYERMVEVDGVESPQLVAAWDTAIGQVQQLIEKLHSRPDPITLIRDTLRL
jgi:ppGpp synthetase/RelA/SpoT-type nucleotidyltranferase